MDIHELMCRTDGMRTRRKEKLMVLAAVRLAAITWYNWHKNYDGNFLIDLDREEKKVEKARGIASPKSEMAAHIRNSLPHWWKDEPAFVTSLFMDIFGLLFLLEEPFQPTPLMKSLARPAYSETTKITCTHCKKPDCILDTGVMNTERLSILADAVEDVYGVNRVVEHLRCGRRLYRGDWAVDLILGKK